MFFFTLKSNDPETTPHKFECLRTQIFGKGRDKIYPGESCFALDGKFYNTFEIPLRILPAKKQIILRENGNGNPMVHNAVILSQDSSTP